MYFQNFLLHSVENYNSVHKWVCTFGDEGAKFVLSQRASVSLVSVSLKFGSTIQEIFSLPVVDYGIWPSR